MSIFIVFAAAILQSCSIVAVAPLVQGIIKSTKARMQGRKGPSWLQPYYDLWKYFHKKPTIADTASWLFVMAPVVMLASMFSLTMLVPVVGSSPLQGLDDLFVLFAFLGLARAMLVLAGLDVGSAFGGMGSSREIFLSILIEPGFILVLLGLAVRSGSSSLSAMALFLAQQGIGSLNVAQLLAMLALMLLLVAESGRLPVDNPDTHLELTMIHEGMLLEHSGPPLAMMAWSSMIKQTILLLLLANLAFPWGITPVTNIVSLAINGVIVGGKVLAGAMILGASEMVEPKMRLFLLPRFLGAAYSIALLSIIAPFFIH